MIKRIKIGIGAAMGVVALAFGGAAIAGATQGADATKALSQAPAVVETSGTDTDHTNSRVGDQTASDNKSGAEAESQNDSDGPGGPDIQQEGEH